jgi:hypothetical protein
METMHAAGRRTLPPVPRAGTERIGSGRTPGGGETVQDTVAPEPVLSDPVRAVPDSREPDAAQEFVERLRSAAPEFAEAAGAESAVVREAVPPARHRRSRCRIVLRFADETESDVTFLGPAGAPGSPSRHGFDRQIRRWLATGLRREAAWLVPDAEASDGMAVDVTAWLAAV